MRLPGIRSTLVLFALLVVLSGPLMGQEWRGPMSFEVRVEDAKGKPVQDASIALEYLSYPVGGPAVLSTDFKGRRGIGSLAPGRWRLEVSKPGFMTFQAEIALSGSDKPEIVTAAQHNVPGAVSTLRVRLAATKSAAPAPARVELAPAPAAMAAAAQAAPVVAPPISNPPAAKPEPATPIAAPAAPAATTSPTPQVEAAPSTSAPASAAPAPVVAPTPEPAREAPAPVTSPPVVAPTVATGAAPPASPSPTPERPAAVLAPTMAETPAVLAKPADAPTTRSAAATAQPVTSAPAAKPAAPTPAEVSEPATVVASPPPAAQAPPAAPTPVVAPAPRVSAAAPLSRACFECKVGESALLAEATIVAGGGGCPATLAADLAASGLDELPALIAGLPSGCAVLRVDLADGARFVGFRYEAAGPVGAAADCLAGHTCPSGGCRFPIAPVIRRYARQTTLLAPFESSETRRGGFTVYWRGGR